MIEAGASTRAWVAGLLAAAALAAAPRALAGPRVFSLDQCADQYVLALAPRSDIAALSTRARNADSDLRGLAVGLPMRRATLESVLAAGPQLVVRQWGGDARLAGALRRRRIAVAQIDEAAGFADVRANVRRVAAALGQQAKGEALIRRMDADLATAAGAGKGRAALYVTPGGATAGPGTLMDAIVRAAGYSNLDRRAGYGSVRLERLVADPPAAVVLAFFTDLASGAQHWTLAGNGRFRALVERRAVASLPGRLLGCPAWFAGDAAAELARTARR